MDETVSVSKGIFVFKNNASNQQNLKLKSKKSKRKSYEQQNHGILSKEITNQLFYKVFTKTWNSIQADISELQKENSIKVLSDVMDFVQHAYDQNFDCLLPVAVILTGVNQPDHLEQFKNIKFAICNELNAEVVITHSRDCSSLKSAIETTVKNFIETSTQFNSDDMDDSDEINYTKKIRKSQCTMQALENWYNNDNDETNGKKQLVIILPDFECFNTEILQDFILILNSYCNRIPFVLIFGVATSTSAIHNTLSYRVTSKIRIKLFQAVSAINSLNTIFDEIILSPKYSFNLSGKVLKFLSDIFLFYDFSINGFIQEFKYCLLEHYLEGGNAFSLCTNYVDSLEILQLLTKDDFETLRQLPSFRPFVESIQNPYKVLSMFENNDYWLTQTEELIKNCHIYFKNFQCCIVFLTSLVKDLPKSPLGKHRRELYTACMSKDITKTEEFKECWKILQFFSKDEFVKKITIAILEMRNFIENHFKEDTEIELDCKTLIFKKIVTLDNLLAELVEITNSENNINSEVTSNVDSVRMQNDFSNLNRHQLKEKLLEMSKKAEISPEKSKNKFQQTIYKILNFIKTEIISEHLKPPTTKDGPIFYELFVFSDITLLRKHIIGTPRAALHTALKDPHHYLQCDCCELDSVQSLKDTLPDLSVAYKLHLECGKLINLYDWLQAFRSILDYQEDESEHIDPKIQARFTRAVAELQFLGYIKTSKRKTDHVSRLTW